MVSVREDAPSPTVTDVLRFEKGFPSQRRSAEEMGEEKVHLFPVRDIYTQTLCFLLRALRLIQ